MKTVIPAYLVTVFRKKGTASPGGLHLTHATGFCFCPYRRAGWLKVLFHIFLTINQV